RGCTSTGRSSATPTRSAWCRSSSSTATSATSRSTCSCPEPASRPAPRHDSCRSGLREEALVLFGEEQVELVVQLAMAGEIGVGVDDLERRLAGERDQLAVAS